jgi:hypothetical protein
MNFRSDLEDLALAVAEVLDLKLARPPADGKRGH